MQNYKIIKYYNFYLFSLILPSHFGGSNKEKKTVIRAWHYDAY